MIANTVVAPRQNLFLDESLYSYTNNVDTNILLEESLVGVEHVLVLKMTIKAKILMVRRPPPRVHARHGRT